MSRAGGKKLAVPKLDLKRKYKHLYSPSAKEVTLVDVPELTFIALDGVVEAGVRPGDSDSFRSHMSAMYGVGYGLKFMSKLREEDPIDFTVMAVEGLWSAESGEFSFETEDNWLYTLLMLQPDHVTQSMFDQAVAEAAEKRPDPAFDDIRLESWREGLSIQIMHVGPYADEPGSIQKMDAFAAVNGYRMRGRHHEIYLGDPTRSKPQNLKTILRHPVEPI